MAAQLRVLTGPAHSGKTAALIARYRQVLKDGPIGGGLWFSPTHRVAADIRTRLLANGLVGCFNPGVVTFDSFIQALLGHAAKPHRYIGRLLKRQLITRLLSQANVENRLQTLGPIADTPGLVELVGNFISDMKRQGITAAELQKMESQRVSPKSQEMATLYADYERLCTEHTLTDSDSQSLAAREFLLKSPPTAWGSFANVACVVADQFSDFTLTQHDILARLAQHANELWIALPLDSQSARADLFLKPQQTLEQLKRRHPKLEIVASLPTVDVPTHGLREVERRLFSNPRDQRPEAKIAGVEILGCAGAKAEIEAIARRVKRLLIEGSGDGKPIPAAEIAVSFRALEPVESLVREVFDDHGIPICIDFRPRLRRAPVLQALVSVLKLQATDWPFRQLLAVLGNNFLKPTWPQWKLSNATHESAGMLDAPAIAEWAVRQFQFPRGRAALLKALHQRAVAETNTDQPADGETLAEDSDAAERRRNQLRYQTASRALTKLADSLVSLDRNRPLSQWVGALQEIVTELGLLRDAKNDDLNNKAWSHLKSALAACEKLEAEWLEAEPALLSLDQLLTQLQTILSIEQLTAESDETGRVRILEAQSLRGLTVPYLFVAGLAEQSFPIASRNRLYSEVDVAALNSLGHRLSNQDERAAEEMLLFYEVITRATTQLVLSYPALDATAQPLLPSPYVIELQRCCENAIQKTNDISLSPVQRGPDVFSKTQRRLNAIAELLDDQPARFASLLRSEPRNPSASSLVAALKCIASRNQSDFGPLEGILPGSRAKQTLAAKYGPEHCWGVSRLEEYAACPFRFFLSNVLAVEELPELSLKTDYMRRGLLTHEALAMMHRQLSSSGESQTPATCESYAQLSNDTLAVLFENLQFGSPLEKALRTIDLRLITQWMQQYAVQHQKYDDQAASANAPLRPAHFEVSFGLKRRSRRRDKTEEVDPISTEKPFAISVEGENILLAGRIDRIDIGLVNNQVVFNIVDYKTGAKKRLTSVEFEAGLALQLPLYAMAVQELLMIDRRAVPWRVGYWYLKDKGFESHSLPQFHELGKAGLQETDAWRELRGSLLSRVISLVRGIRSGQFPVYNLDQECTSRCEYRTVCRVSHIRALDKQWVAPNPPVLESLTEK